MRIAVFPLGPLETNCYLIHNDKEAVAIDVGGEPSPVLDYMKRQGITLNRILCTHLHFDHTYGVQALISATGAPVYASEKDRFLLEDGSGRGGVWGMPKVEEYVFKNIEPGPLSVLGTACDVLATPGHTPGGLSFSFPEELAVFVGDTLFYRSIGRTDFPGGSFDTLARAIHTQLFTLAEKTTAYPGHGPHTVIGDEKRNNPFVSDFVL